MTSRVPGSSPGGSGVFFSFQAVPTSPTDPLNNNNNNNNNNNINWFEGKRQTGKV